MILRKYSKHELKEARGYEETLGIHKIYEKEIEAVDLGKAIWDIMSDEMFEIYRESMFSNFKLLDSIDIDFIADIQEPILSWAGYQFTLRNNGIGTRITRFYCVTNY